MQCENCHAGAPAHAADLLRGAPKPAAIATLKDFTAKQTSQLCGRCHRTFSDIKAVGPRGVANVRFQPYRIQFSKCWDAADPRISCTACHDPHNTSQSVPPRANDKACQSCHNANPKTRRTSRLCQVAKDDCVTCHMPKFEIPNSHHEFADHFIRIARAGAPYPD